MPRNTAIDKVESAVAAGVESSPSWLIEAVQMAPVGIFVTDADGECLLVNHRWSEITGLDAVAARGRGWMRMLAPDDAAAMLEHWLTVVRTGRIASRDVVVHMADGARRWGHLYTVPIHRPDGGLVGFIGMIADVSEQHEVESAYRTLVEQSLQGYLVFQDGRPVFANRAMSEISGYSNAELLEASLAEGMARIHADDRERIAAALPREVGGEAPRDRLELRLVRKDGAVRWLELAIRAMEYRGRPALQVVSVDVTERRALADALQQVNSELDQRVRERTAQLEEALRELESFSYSVSHDLRAPLRAIDGFSHALLEDHAAALDAEGLDYLRRVRRAAHHMGDLIDDLLALSRVTRSEIGRLPVDLSALAEEVVDELRRAVPERTATVLIAPGLRVDGDPALLRTLLANLFSNALKFTAGQVAPCVELAELPASSPPTFVVRDNGVGFDMQYADKLFRPFHRLHDPGRYEGTGIGLATVQRIVARHGGRVWAESAPAEGAAFFFTLGRTRD